MIEKSTNLERQLLVLVVLAGVPGTALGLGLLWSHSAAGGWPWVVTVLLAAIWLGFLWTFRRRLSRQLQTMANLLSSLREGDFSIRVRDTHDRSAFGDLVREVNALSETLREQRLGALEATALLQTVMEEIDVAVFAFDEAQRLRLVNRAGARLLARSAPQMLGHTAAELNLADALGGESPRPWQHSFPGATGRWALSRGQFRQGGLPHQLLVISDLSRELREEERLAWQRLVRVLGHELNNSLAPIKSIAGSLEGLIQRDPPPADWREDVHRGLNVIGTRAEALTRFVGGYSRLAKLPSPRLQPVPLDILVRRVAGLETRVPVEVQAGPAVRLRADPDQLEQLMINLVRNAADAACEARESSKAAVAGEAQPSAVPAEVRVGWTLKGDGVEIWIEDNGPGLANTNNLFVPFFTTKPKGSGIGLVLSRQIAEAHGGHLELRNRGAGVSGCRAVLQLPL